MDCRQPPVSCQLPITEHRDSPTGSIEPFAPPLLSDSPPLCDFYLLRTLPKIHRQAPIAISKAMRRFKQTKKESWTHLTATLHPASMVLGVSNKTRDSPVVFVACSGSVMAYDTKRQLASDLDTINPLNDVARVFRHKNFTIFMSYNVTQAVRVFSPDVSGPPLCTFAPAVIKSGYSKSYLYDAFSKMNEKHLFYIQLKSRSLVRISFEKLFASLTSGTSYMPLMIDSDVMTFAAPQRWRGKVFHIKKPGVKLYCGKELLADFSEIATSVNCMGTTRNYVILPLDLKLGLRSQLHLLNLKGTILHKLSLSKGSVTNLQMLETDRLTICSTIRNLRFLDLIITYRGRLHSLVQNKKFDDAEILTANLELSYGKELELLIAGTPRFIEKLTYRW